MYLSDEMLCPDAMNDGEFIQICPNSSVVEHAAVNRGVTGSSPVWGA